MNRQLAARLDGEARAQLSLLRLLCAVSVWRCGMTRVLPLCGVSAWWMTLVCLLPGVLTVLLLRLLMSLTHTSVLSDAVRACLGRSGAAALAVVLCVLLITDGVASITALITLFTEGLGTRGTQLTLAILTGVMLLCSLHREGLARAVCFLRWGMLGAAVVTAACLLPDAHADGLFPLYGAGSEALPAALKAGFSLAWPLSLLLTVPPPREKGRLQNAVGPVFGAVAAILLLTLFLPHELLSRVRGIAAILQLPTRYAPNALHLLAMCLLMLAFFLAIGACVQLSAVHLSAPLQSTPGWLPCALLSGMFATQAADVSRLWRVLGAVEPYLLAPLALLAAVCLPIAILRRKR